MNKRGKIIYRYPLSRVNLGTMLGNGHIGLFVWGEGSQLNITVGCSDVWDHRGGMDWTPEQNLHDIQEALYGKDMQRLKAIFTPVIPEGYPARPSLIPIGRLTMKLPKNSQLLLNEVNESKGLLEIRYRQEGVLRRIRLLLNMENDEFSFKCGDVSEWELKPAYAISDALKERGFKRPKIVRREVASSFVQSMPNERDASYGLGVFVRGERFHVVFGRGKSNEELIELARNGKSFTPARYWRDFWKGLPEVNFADETLQSWYRELMFRFEGMTEVHGGPAGLQGPWIEDTGLPPWSGDYHFNINVQMCYSPALRARRWETLKKLFGMVLSWREKLRNNARMFLGIDNGYMLPHAVDDTGRCMGGFWTGTLDHGCTAWMAQMMFDYVDYSGDMDFLRRDAYDFMQGAFNVYYGMLTEKDGKLGMLVTTSPEYRGSAMNAWGANASFQLAACHRLTRNLLRAAEMLGEQPKPEWLKVERDLPQATLLPCVNDGVETGAVLLEGEQEIGLWEGQYLDVSHRHHSHLAALYPFNTIDKDSPEWSKIVANSVRRWRSKGMNGWTGWCMPWAAALCMRLDQPEAARTILNLWHQAFVNKGGATTHDACFPGIFEFCGRPDIIQMEATGGALSAMQDMLLHERNGVLHVFSGLTCDASFANMPAPGGFTFDASLQEGVCKLRICASRDGVLRIKLHGLENSKVTCVMDKQKRQCNAKGILTFSMKAGQVLEIHN